jgi:hypothetical protein
MPSFLGSRTAGAALLLGRWLAVRYAGLAPVRRSSECLAAAVSLFRSRPRWYRGIYQR